MSETQCQQKTWIRCADTAKFIRKALKREFPGASFSVRSKTYSGGASIDIDWEDGPTLDAVKSLTCRYRGATFDGMIDLKEYHSGELTYRDDPKRDGECVQFGADFIFCERRYSEAKARKVRDELVAKWSRAPGDFPELRESYGCGWVLDWDHPSNDGRNSGPGGCDPSYQFQQAIEERN